MLPSFLLTLVGILPLTTIAYDTSQKDPNTYPWGDNPNNDYKMYWKDSANVLSSLTEFSALYIKVHGCVWSEYGLGDTFDDDGENHDGDEQWYLTRVQSFRANAAFSLYGELKGTVNLGRSCRKGTYINTFFTAEGADTVLQAFQSNVQTAFPDELYGSAYCYEYEAYDETFSVIYSDDDGDRRLGSGSGDGDDAIPYNSMTMGCSANSRFELAHFQGPGCDGNYYLNSTDGLGKYNRAIGSLSCARVWNYGKDANGADDGDDNDGDNANMYNYGDDSSSASYGSIAETLLASSFSCDINMYPNGLCPDPYGLKAKYNRNIIASARSGEPTMLLDWQSPMLLLSQFIFMVGFALGSFSYFALRRDAVMTNGGGFKGWMRQIWSDIYGLLCVTNKAPKTNSKNRRKNLRRNRSGTISNNPEQSISPGRLRRNTSNPKGQVKRNRSGPTSPEKLRRKTSSPNRQVRRNRSEATTPEHLRRKTSSSNRKVRKTRSSGNERTTTRTAQTPDSVSPTPSTLHVVEEENPFEEESRPAVEEVRPTVDEGTLSIEEKREFV